MAQDLSALTPPFARHFATSTKATQVILPASARKISICGSGTLLVAHSGTDGAGLASGVGYFIATSQCYHGTLGKPNGDRTIGGTSVFIQANSGTPTAYLDIE